MLFFTLVQGGPDAMFVEALGIPAAHLYDFLAHYWPEYGGGINLLKTPNFVHRLFENVHGAKGVTVKGHGTAYRSAPTTSATSSGNNWGSRGQGRRLGSD